MSRFNRTVMSIAAGMLLGCAHAQQAPGPAQSPPSPEQMKQIMQATMGAMVSIMGPMTDVVIEAQLAAAAKPETAERLATFKRNLYEALVRKGFDRQEALQIVITASAPAAAPNVR